MDTDGSRRSRVNEKKNPLEPRVTQAPTLGASKKDGGGSEVRFALYIQRHAKNSASYPGQFTLSELPEKACNLVR